MHVLGTEQMARKDAKVQYEQGNGQLAAQEWAEIKGKVDGSKETCRPPSSFRVL